jgi:hypothetical protein
MVTSDQLNTISFWVLLVILVIYFIYVLLIAIFFPYFEFIVAKPFSFITEILLIATLTCLPMALIAYNRNMPFKEAMIMLVALWIKLAILHVVLEISGFYAWTVTSLSLKEVKQE